MIQKFKKALLVLATLVATGVPVLAPVSVYALNANVTDSLCKGTNIATETNGYSTDGCAKSGVGGSSDKLYALARQIVNIFSVIVGIIAVIMIIYGGFKYITSGGDSGNVTGAKNTLIYAIVGLIIVALAQFIVRFVLGQANSIAG